MHDSAHVLDTREKCITYCILLSNCVQSIQTIRIRLVDHVQHDVVPLEIKYI